MKEKAADFVESKLLEYRAELEKVLDGGDISEYNFCGISDENIGVYDKNSPQRLRIALAIWYMSENLDVEYLTVALMNEEIKCLENEAFGGMSETVILLSRKLLQYNKNYRYLFKKAKHANFDCFCGYEVWHIKKFSKHFSDWHNADWEYMFELMNDKESLEIFKKLNQN